MTEKSMATLVVITSVMLQCAVDCTRSLFDLVTSVGYTATETWNGVICVVACE